MVSARRQGQKVQGRHRRPRTDNPPHQAGTVFRIQGLFRRRALRVERGHARALDPRHHTHVAGSRHDTQQQQSGHVLHPRALAQSGLVRHQDRQPDPEAHTRTFGRGTDGAARQLWL